MVSDFIFSSILICGVLYLPGFFILKAVRMKGWRAVAFAPLVSIPLYCVLGIVYSKASIHATAISVGLPVFLFSLLVLGFSLLFVDHGKKKVSARTDEGSKGCELGLIPILYISMGTLIYAIFYLGALPTLGHVAETYDNVFHFNLIRSFVDSGIWSSLNATVYLDNGPGYPSPLSSASGYYPAAWHTIASFPVSLLGVPVGVAANATNFVFVTCAYGLSACLFIQKLFASSRRALVIGAFVTFAFGSYPWVLLAHWPLFPNLISMTLVLLLCLSFMLAVDARVQRKQRALYACLFIAGIMTEAFCQPNAVFTAMVLMIPYVVFVGSKVVWERLRARIERSGDRERAGSIGMRILIGAIIVVLVAVCWFAFFKVPFLQSTVNYYWAPIMSVTQAMASVLSLSLALTVSQYGLGILVVIGTLYIIIRKRELLWVVFSYIFAACLFIVAASFGDSLIKHLLTGFWYTDPYRLAALVGMAGVPLAVVGLSALCEFACYFMTKIGLKDAHGYLGKIVAPVVVALACVAIYSPVMPKSTVVPMFQHIHNIAGAHAASMSNVAYDDEEKAFVEKVKDLIDEEDVVLNHPYDGSMLAYGLNDLSSYYRSIAGYGKQSESEQSVILRERLSSLASDKEVQEAIGETSADYVLILENDEERMRHFYRTSYDQQLWAGFESITDDTPGLELVLADGEMRLYKIVAP